MGAQRAQMKRVFPACFVGLVVPVQETFILPWLLWSAQYIIVFSSPYTISILCPHLPVTWAGSRARPPVSECVSPGPTEYEAEGSKGEYVGSKELPCVK